MRIIIETDDSTPAPRVTTVPGDPVVVIAPDPGPPPVAAAAAVSFTVHDGGAAGGIEIGADTTVAAGDAINAGPANYGGVAAPAAGTSNGDGAALAAAGVNDGGAAPDA